MIAQNVEKTIKANFVGLPVHLFLNVTINPVTWVNSCWGSSYCQCTNLSLQIIVMIQKATFNDICLYLILKCWKEIQIIGIYQLMIIKYYTCGVHSKSQGSTLEDNISRPDISFIPQKTNEMAYFSRLYYS